jgi:SAM-dependent methyltransferase
MHGGEDVDLADRFTEEYWDERYGDTPIWSGNPNPLLVHYATPLPPGHALDAGTGEGADAIWLAAQGWAVTAVDVSTVALRRAEEVAGRAGEQIAARISWQQADLLTWAPPERQFDLVSAQFMQLPEAWRESLHRRLAAAVRPGGTFLVVSHHPEDLKGLRHDFPAELFATGEQMATLFDPAEWAVETAAPQRQAKHPDDGSPITIRDAVLRAVRR